MTNKCYGAVIIRREIGSELAAPIVRFLRSIEDKKFRTIYDGESPTSFGRYTGRHEVFEESDETPEYDIGLNENGELHLRRREKSIEDELFSIEYIERTEPPNF